MEQASLFRAWLRFERREDELVGSSSMDCGGGRVIECPKASFINGYDPESVYDPCPVSTECKTFDQEEEEEEEECSTSDEDEDGDGDGDLFLYWDEEVRCYRYFSKRVTKVAVQFDVMRLFCGPEAKERLKKVGHASFTLYYFLSQVAMEEDMKSNTTVMLLERLGECAGQRGWQKQLALHQLGCVMLERKEYKDAQHWLNCQKAATRSFAAGSNHSSSEHERLVYEGWILYDTGHREEALAKAEESISIQRSFEAFFLKAYALADTSLDSESSSYVIQLLEEALRCPSDGLRKGQALNNLGSVYADCDKLDLAADCYVNALNIRHTRAHQGLARVYHLKNQRKAAYDEMAKLIDKARNNASAYEKRSEYCDRDMARSDLSMATQLDPLRTYPYRYRAAVAQLKLALTSSGWVSTVLMDDHKEAEAIAELSKAIAFKPDLQLLHLRAAFYDSMGDSLSTLRDCEAALCLDPNHADTLELYKKAQDRANEPLHIKRSIL
ncbi:hypothetical protein IFM89_012851 [Coptis chinensis]|uniref:Uncharacterized protein n=1 Tax=Coptis chinensis TaxID=261450 RepID=A0A835HE20_9MAGN|nr:hypothetical protein IFM89_012851 [Coptis chinensis]